MAVIDLLDVVVVGGGPAGACAACLLLDAPGRSPLRITVLEPRQPTAPVAGEPLDSRVVALSRASERILRGAGAWSHLLPARIQPYERMRIWHESTNPFSAGALVFDAAEINEPNLGYIVENRMLQAALLRAFQDRGGQLQHEELQAVEIQPEYVKLTLRSGLGLHARLVIGADGAQSPLRQLVGLNASNRDLLQTAIVATVAGEKPHGNTAWQRFMRDGTLALLPLPDGNTSIVWSADNELAGHLLAMQPDAFGKALTQAAGNALGSLQAVSPLVTFPLWRLDAERYIANRCALIGDAAHVVHPLAGQGINLGLLDAAAVAQLAVAAVAEREDPGAQRVLRVYERWRRTEVAVMSTAISAFDRLLAHGRGPVSRLAQSALGWVNRSQEIKRLLAARALGTTGELPRVAR